MAINFRDSDAFVKETLATAGGALVLGTVVGAVAPSLVPLPLEVLAGAGALVGGAVGAVLTRPRPQSRLVRGALGLAGGTLAAGGFVSLAAGLGLGVVGLLVGAGLGGLALGALLGAEESPSGARPHPLAQLLGMSAATLTGLVGGAALLKASAFAISESAPTAPAAGALAGLLALWIAAAAGLRRLEKQKDPLLVKADEVLQGLADPARSRVADGLATWNEIDAALEREGGIDGAQKDEAKKQARALLDALLETARTWGQINADLVSPRLKGIDEKLLDLARRQGETEDSVTLGHLGRAQQALLAQKAAVDGLSVGRTRAEAALDAQVALLERLRLAVAQHRVSDRERFALELSAVSDQVARLSDDLESLSSAIAEAEALADRKLLADLERAGRRAMDNLNALEADSDVARAVETLESADTVEAAVAVKKA